MSPTSKLDAIAVRRTRATLLLEYDVSAEVMMADRLLRPFAPSRAKVLIQDGTIHEIELSGELSPDGGTGALWFTGSRVAEALSQPATVPVLTRVAREALEDAAALAELGTI